MRPLPTAALALLAVLLLPPLAAAQTWVLSPTVAYKNTTAVLTLTGAVPGQVSEFRYTSCGAAGADTIAASPVSATGTVTLTIPDSVDAGWYEPCAPVGTARLSAALAPLYVQDRAELPQRRYVHGDPMQLELTGSAATVQSLFLSAHPRCDTTAAVLCAWTPTTTRCSFTAAAAIAAQSYTACIEVAFGGRGPVAGDASATVEAYSATPTVAYGGVNTTLTLGGDTPCAPTWISPSAACTAATFTLACTATGGGGGGVGAVQRVLDPVVLAEPIAPAVAYMAYVCALPDFTAGRVSPASRIAAAAISVRRKPVVTFAPEPLVQGLTAAVGLVAVGATTVLLAPTIECESPSAVVTTVAGAGSLVPGTSFPTGLSFVCVRTTEGTAYAVRTVGVRAFAVAHGPLFAAPGQALSVDADTPAGTVLRFAGDAACAAPAATVTSAAAVGPAAPVATGDLSAAEGVGRHVCVVSGAAVTRVAAATVYAVPTVAPERVVALQTSLVVSGMAAGVEVHVSAVGGACDAALLATAAEATGAAGGAALHLAVSFTGPGSYAVCAGYPNSAGAAVPVLVGTVVVGTTTASVSLTATASLPPTPTGTVSAGTPTASATATVSATTSGTVSAASPTVTAASSQSQTTSGTASAVSPTATAPHSVTATASTSLTAATATATAALSPSASRAATRTLTASLSATPTAAVTATKLTASGTATVSRPPSATATATATITATTSESSSPSTTPATTATVSASASTQPSVTLTARATLSATTAATASVSATLSLPPTASASAAATATRSLSWTPTQSASPSRSGSVSGSASQPRKGTPTPSRTATSPATPSWPATPTPHRSATATVVPTPTATAPLTMSHSRSWTATQEPPRTRTPTLLPTPTRSATVLSGYALLLPAAASACAPFAIAFQAATAVSAHAATMVALVANGSCCGAGRGATVANATRTAAALQWEVVVPEEGYRTAVDAAGSDGSSSSAAAGALRACTTNAALGVCEDGGSLLLTATACAGATAAPLASGSAAGVAYLGGAVAEGSGVALWQVALIAAAALLLVVCLLCLLCLCGCCWKRRDKTAPTREEKAAAAAYTCELGHFALPVSSDGSTATQGAAESEVVAVDHPATARVLQQRTVKGFGMGGARAKPAPATSAVVDGALAIGRRSGQPGAASDRARLTAVGRLEAEEGFERRRVEWQWAAEGESFRPPWGDARRAPDGGTPLEGSGTAPPTVVAAPSVEEAEEEARRVLEHSERDLLRHVVSCMEAERTAIEEMLLARYAAEDEAAAQTFSAQVEHVRSMLRTLQPLPHRHERPPSPMPSAIGRRSADTSMRTPLRAHSSRFVYHSSAAAAHASETFLRRPQDDFSRLSAGLSAPSVATPGRAAASPVRAAGRYAVLGTSSSVLTPVARRTAPSLERAFTPVHPGHRRVDSERTEAEPIAAKVDRLVSDRRDATPGRPSRTFEMDLSGIASPPSDPSHIPASGAKMHRYPYGRATSQAQHHHAFSGGPLAPRSGVAATSSIRAVSAVQALATRSGKFQSPAWPNPSAPTAGAPQPGYLEAVGISGAAQPTPPAVLEFRSPGDVEEVEETVTPPPVEQGRDRRSGGTSPLGYAAQPRPRRDYALSSTDSEEPAPAPPAVAPAVVPDVFDAALVLASVSPQRPSQSPHAARGSPDAAANPLESLAPTVLRQRAAHLARVEEQRREAALPASPDPTVLASRRDEGTSSPLGFVDGPDAFPAPPTAAPWADGAFGSPLHSPE